jgi:hypothetical protein
MAARTWYQRRRWSQFGIGTGGLPTRLSGAIRRAPWVRMRGATVGGGRRRPRRALVTPGKDLYPNAGACDARRRGESACAARSRNEPGAPIRLGGSGAWGEMGGISGAGAATARGRAGP